MTPTVRRLGPGDEAILERLALDEPDFDLEGRSEAGDPPTPAQARAYLANPAVLHWVAEADGAVVGDLLCYQLPLDGGAGQELVLYDIGVRSAWRRKGVGGALLAELERWMLANEVEEVWVLADNEGAVAFYRAAGFAAEQPQPVYLTRTLPGAEG